MNRPFCCYRTSVINLLAGLVCLVIGVTLSAEEADRSNHPAVAGGLQLILQLDGEVLHERSVMAISKAPQANMAADGWSFALVHDGKDVGLTSRVHLSPPADPSRLVTIRLAWPSVGMIGELRGADGRTIYRTVFDAETLERAITKSDRLRLKASSKTGGNNDTAAAQRLQRQLQWQNDSLQAEVEAHHHADGFVPPLSDQLGALPSVDRDDLKLQQAFDDFLRHRTPGTDPKDVDPRHLFSGPYRDKGAAIYQSTGTTINGQLLDSDGAPVMHTWVNFYDTNYNYQGGFYSGDNGHLQVDLPTGEYLLYIYGPAPLVPMAGQPFDLSEDGFEIVLDIGVTLDVVLRQPNGAAASFNPPPWVCVFPAWDQGLEMTYVGGSCVNANAGTLTLAADRPYRTHVNDLPHPWISTPVEVTLSESSTMDVQVIRGRTVTLLGEGGDPLPFVDLWMYDDNDDYLGYRRTDDLGRFVADLPTGQYALAISPPAPYLRWSRKQVSIDGPGDISIELPKGAVIELDFAGIEPPAEGWICVYFQQTPTGAYAGLGGSCSHVAADDPQLILRKSWPYRTYSSSLPVPWLLLPETLFFAGDGTYQAPLQLGVEVPISVQAHNGGALSFNANGRWPAGASYHQSLQALVLPQGHDPLVVDIDPHDPAYGYYSAPPRVYAEGDAIDVTLRQKGQLTGTITGDDGQAIFAYVRAYKAGRYVAGTRTSSSTGEYELYLPKQTYRIDVIPIVGRCCELYLPTQTYRNIQVTTGSELDAVVEKNTVDLNLNGPNQRRRVEVRQDDTLLSVGYYQYWETPKIAPGIYDLTIEVVGYRPKVFSDFDLTRNRTVNLSSATPRTWSGTLKTADGQVVEGVQVSAFDEVQQRRSAVLTDAAGRFDVPIGKDYSVRFNQPRTGQSIRSLQKVDRLVSREQDVILKDLQFESMDGDFGRVYTSNSPDPYKVIILAESYHENAESYTDENGNGVWDGIFFIDTNGNGLWDNGESFSRYGDVDYPVSGENPTLQNEPFDDANGDGYLSFGGRQVFEQNVRTFVRDWLAADFWRDNQDKFEVYAYFQDSPEEGMDLISVDNQVLVDRDTPLGAVFRLNRHLLGVDYTAALELATSVMPDFDGIVVMINQPVPAGRANSFQLYNGGVNQPVNSNTPSHEYGHSVGGLADEYSEFPGNYDGPEPWANNVTKFNEADHLPWTMDEGATLFSVPFSKGQGHFEGASYRQGSVFRPTYVSKMSSNRDYFNQVSIDQLWDNAPRLGMTRTLDADLDGDGMDEWVLRSRRPDALFVGQHLQHDSLSAGLSNAVWSPDWQIVGTGNVDGLSSEVMFARHQGTGKYRTFVVGEQLVASSPLAGLPTSSAMQAITIAHFDSDGQSDLLARNRSTGKWKLYLSGNGRWTDAGVLPFLFRSTAWRLAGHGDFNGDGIEDVVLRNANGKWKQYILNGSSFISKRNTNLPRNTQVQLVATGDFNGNGRDDVVLVDKQSGDFLVATSNTSGGIGRARTVSGLQGLANAWSVRGSGDYDGTGRDQVLLRNKTDGSWQQVSFEGGAAGRATLASVDLPDSGRYSH
ncbi:MAG: hypothetical protein DHS20C11_05400 [Lysobacteraceae bacterium]|nr:MAG: hypothetical protein DHS20C11_05400 [Xanthomonadaceae bacterium]